jgi:hypothetical protein
MSDSKHTPGPWQCHWIDTHLNSGVFEIGSLSACVLASHRTANARLIVAAPEMFDLLQRVADHFVDTDSPLGMDARRILGNVEGR